MSVKQIIVRPEAESDIKDAYDWYEAQRKGLGENFLLCIEEALSRASRNPEVYSVVFDKDVRRVLIHRFPFSVFFIKGEESIYVFGGTSCSKKPKNVEGARITRPFCKAVQFRHFSAA